MKITQLYTACVITYLMSLTSVFAAPNVGICSIRTRMDVPSGKIAFCTGDLKDSIYIRSGEPANLYILDIKDKTVHCVMDKKVISFSGWRTVNGESELWVSKNVYTIWPWPRFHYQLVSVKKIGDNIITKKIKSPEIVFAFTWSPNGEILAGKPKRDFTQPLFDSSTNYHSVGISFSEGRDAYIYLDSPVNAIRLFWKDDRTFYTQGVHGKTIMEFHVQNEKIIPGKVLEYEDRITLFGIFEGDLVYRRNGNLYIDDNMVYDSETAVKRVQVSPPYIFFVEDSNIVVVNITEKNIYKRNVENTDIFSIGLDPHADKAYWLSLPDKIYSWDFRQDEIEAIFRISE